MFSDKAKSIFIKPPTVEALRTRLEGRGTDSPEAIDERVRKAEYELSFAPEYDCVVVNDDLQQAIDNTEREILEFTC